MSLRVVFDTNTRVSAIVFKGTPLQAIEHASAPHFEQLISDILFTELKNVLENKFQSRGIAIDLELSEIRRQSILVHPLETISGCRDSDDNRVLECAIAGSADLIVSGDRDLLVLGDFRGIRILTARAFVNEFCSSDSEYRRI